MNFSLEVCCAIHAEAVCAQPLNSRDRLEAALAAPFQTWEGTELFPTLAEKAARLTHSIAEAQAFGDGNKRLAWSCCLEFLAQHGYTIQADQQEAADRIWALGRRHTDGSPELDLEGLTLWMNAHMVRLSAG